MGESSVSPCFEEGVFVCELDICERGLLGERCVCVFVFSGKEFFGVVKDFFAVFGDEPKDVSGVEVCGVHCGGNDVGGPGRPFAVELQGDVESVFGGFGDEIVESVELFLSEIVG